LNHPFSFWRQVAEDAELLRRAAAADPTRVAEVAGLRKRYTAEQVAVALDLTAARRKAQLKFGDYADGWIADPAGVEQATALPVARHKARRLGAAGVERVIDLGCGVGGDAMGFVSEGLETLAVDRDPVRAAMAGHNAGCRWRVADAAEFLITGVDALAGTDGRVPPAGENETPAFPLAGAALHLDPARRTGDDGRRLHRLTDHEPDPATIRRLLARFPDAALKLSPAVDLDELAEAYLLRSIESDADPQRHDNKPPAAAKPPAAPTLEFISHHGRLVQAVLYFGRLADPAAPRQATRLTDDDTHTLAADPATLPPLELSPPRRHLFTVDPAVERAGLMPALGLPALHPKLGLLTADNYSQSQGMAIPRRSGNISDPTPWLTPFTFLADLPFRPDHLQPIRDWLAAHDAGHVEIKTRGKAVDPDRLQPQLHGPGSQPHTLFILRFDHTLRCLITRRLKLSFT
jgi:hypothetical protein